MSIENGWEDKLHSPHRYTNRKKKICAHEKSVVESYTVIHSFALLYQLHSCFLSFRLPRGTLVNCSAPSPNKMLVIIFPFPQGMVRLAHSAWAHSWMQCPLPLSIHISLFLFPSEHPKILLPRTLRQTYVRKVGDTVNLLIPFQVITIRPTLCVQLRPGY